MSDDGISLRALSRDLGVTLRAVQKAIESGRIPASAVGTKTLPSGKTRPCIVDRDAAIAGFRSNVDSRQQRPGKAISQGKKRANAIARGEEPDADLPPDADYDPAPQPRTTAAPRNPNIPSQAESRAITEAYKARMAKIDYQKATEQLVEWAPLKVKLSEMIVDARGKVMMVPRKARSRIPHLTIDDMEILESLLERALEELSVGD